ncbi:MAG: hypothetical protein K9J21_00770 [Bacteroidales bacterium]|nr:hypothetical protein [Bacteroidales bacterium]
MNKLHYIFAFLLLMTGSVSFLHAQEFEVNAKLDTNAIQIGEQTTFDFIVTVSSDRHVQWPDIQDTLTEKIEIVNIKKADTNLIDESFREITKSYTITSFDSGYHAIPPFSFAFGKDSLSTEAMLLQVQTLNVDTTKAIKPIKGIYEEPLKFRDFLPWILGAIALLIIAALAYYFIRKRKKQKSIDKPIPVKPALPADEEALSRLQELEDKKLWHNNQTKKYYIELTAIIRHYIERRFNVDAEELTSREILQQISPVTPEDAYKMLKSLLELADLVKFARVIPLPDENAQSMKSAKQFVEMTRKDEENEKTEEANNVE